MVSSYVFIIFQVVTQGFEIAEGTEELKAKQAGATACEVL